MTPDQTLAQAVAAHQAGRLREAAKLYRAIIAADPGHADACALLGVAICACGEFAEAVQWVDRAVALDPHSGLLYFHQGTVLMAAQQLPAALAAFARAVELQPDMAQIHFNYANGLRAADDWMAAIAHYRQALRLDAGFLDAYVNLALSLVHEGQYEEAMSLAQQAVALNPDYGQGWLTVCNVGEKLKQYDAALHAGEQAARLMPGDHFAWFGYGVALNRVGRDADAIAVYQRALELNPRRADICDNLAQTYQSLNRLPEAEAAFRKAVEVAGQAIPDENGREVDESEYGNHHWHLALMELLRGDYSAGFARYRARFKEIKELKRPIYPFPLWKGEDLRGKSLLVYDEQGYGDTLMLARFLPMLRAGGARVVFSVHPVLVPLLRGWDGADEVIAHGEATPPCDYFCSTFDLPHRMRITLDNLPGVVPYLPLLPSGDDILPATEGKKIGVVWGGSPLHLNDAKRSMPLAVLADLFDLPDCAFYSFNRDLKPGDDTLLPHLRIDNLVPRLRDFAAAARLIAQMDLVITVDTATAHLAGGLGKPVWVMLPFAPDWRWLTGRDDSPWYPTARLFRQPAPGDWRGVVAAVKSALRGL